MNYGTHTQYKIKKNEYLKLFQKHYRKFVFCLLYLWEGDECASCCLAVWLPARSARLAASPPVRLTTTVRNIHRLENLFLSSIVEQACAPTLIAADT